ncbi:MAG: hypothetical protein Q9203_004092 [Teloschistes exilis]
MASPAVTLVQPTHAPRDIQSTPSALPTNDLVTLSESQPVLGADCSTHNQNPFTSVTSNQRVRKRVPWRGKTCIISLPTPPSNKGSIEHRYLTPVDVSTSLDVWQELGYDVAGFQLDHGSPSSLDVPGSGAQSRTSFPDHGEIATERACRLYRVRIPDQAQWNDYVHALKEAKLRALGVTSRSDGDKEQMSPTISHTECRPSSHIPSHPISPSSLPRLDLSMNHAHNIAPRSQDWPDLVSSARLSDVESFDNTAVRHLPRYSVLQPRVSPALLTSHHIPLAQSPDSQFCPPRIFAVHDSSPRRHSPAFDLASQNSFDRSDTIFPSAPSLDDPTAAQYGLGNTPSRDQRSVVEKSHQALEQRNSCLFGDTVASSEYAVAEKQIAQSRELAESIQQPGPQSHMDSLPNALERRVRGAEAGAQTIQDWSQGQIGPVKDDVEQGGEYSTKEWRLASHDHAAIHDGNSVKHSESQCGSRPPASNLNALAPVFEFGTGQAGSIASTKMRPTTAPFSPGNASRQLPQVRELSPSLAGPFFRSKSRGVGEDTGDSTVEHGNTVFGKVKLIPGNHAARKSKAIPIREPKERCLLDPKSQVQEDGSGRIAQAEDRQGLLRRSNAGNIQGNGRASPLFNAQQTGDDRLSFPQATSNDHIPNSSFSVEEAVQAANAPKKETNDASSVLETSSTQEQGTLDAEFTFQDFTEAIAFDNARPRSLSARDRVRQKSRANTDNDSPTGSTEKQQKVYASDDSRKASSPSIINGHSGLTRMVTLPDHDKLNDLRQRELAALNSCSDSSASCDTGELLQAEASHVSSTDTDERNVRNGGDVTRISPPVADGFSYIDPSYEEIDAVMKHLNEEDHQVQRADVALYQYHQKKPETRPCDDYSQDYSCRQQSGYDSVNSLVDNVIARDVRSSPSSRASSNASESSRTSCKNAVQASNCTANKRNDAPSLGDSERRNRRRNFSKMGFEDMMTNVIQLRLAPLEQSLVAIQGFLADQRGHSPGMGERSRPRDNADMSDADDENDVRIPSPFEDRRSNRLRNIITEIITAHRKTFMANELGDITEAMKDVKNLLHEAHPSLSDIKVALEEAMGKQMRGRSAPIASSHQSATVEKNQLQIAGLESMLKIAEARAEDELKARRATEDALADSQRLLRLALQDAAEQRESAEETERSLSAFHEERHEVLRRTAVLEGTQESLQKTAYDLVEKNGALEGTLEEYRLSSSQWRKEIDDAKAENDDLRRITHALRAEMEDSIRGRQALKNRYEQLQNEMISASQNLARDQVSWRIKEEEQKARCETLNAEFETERQTRKHLEDEIASLSETLRLNQGKHHQDVAQYELQIHNQKEVARLERERMQDHMADNGKAAGRELSTIRTQLESIVIDLKAQTRQAHEAATLKMTEYEQLLHKAASSRFTDLEERQKINDNFLNGLQQQHEHTLQSTLQEKQQVERQSDERSAFADEKLTHYRDRISHLEEKLEIAKSAAQAAVQVAQSQRSTSDASHQRVSSFSGPLGHLPQKTSPQALRESILVLQEQLQDRESQIERLEKQISVVDVHAPAKCKAQETEIAWLRELLNMRTDDLQDLIITLAQPAYNREAVKDAAIRLKANIEMEQQEKERALSVPQSNPSLANISTLASSPRAIPLAAAAAWGNWRRGKTAALSDSTTVARNQPAETPSRPLPLMPGMVSGLLTPPRSDLRNCSQSNAGSRTPTPTSSWRNSTIDIPSQNSRLTGHGEPAQRSSLPQTPSLTRKASYDADAARADVEGVRSMMNDTEDGRKPPNEEEPFGPRIAAFHASELYRH